LVVRSNQTSGIVLQLQFESGNPLANVCMVLEEEQLLAEGNAETLPHLLSMLLTGGTAYVLEEK